MARIRNAPQRISPGDETLPQTCTPTSLERYHAVPQGWQAEEIVAFHRQMRGTYPIAEIEIGTWHAPAWMTERHAWLKYCAVLRKVADGVRAGDSACTEIAVNYILLHHIGSYSGYLRSRLARALRHADIPPRKKVELVSHFDHLAAAHAYTFEWREYRKLRQKLG